jgi:hypothetical protein
VLLQLLKWVCIDWHFFIVIVCLMCVFPGGVSGVGAGGATAGGGGGNNHISSIKESDSKSSKKIETKKKIVCSFI